MFSRINLLAIATASLLAVVPNVFTTAAQAASDTEIALTSQSPNKIVVGEPVDLTAVVSGIDALLPPPTGTVSFRDGATSLGTVPLVTVGTGQPLGAGESTTCALNANQNGLYGCWGEKLPFKLRSGITTIVVGTKYVCGLASDHVECRGEDTVGETPSHQLWAPPLPSRRVTTRSAL